HHHDRRQPVPAGAVAAAQCQRQTGVEPARGRFLTAAVKAGYQQGLARHQRHLLNRPIAVNGDLLQLQRVVAGTERDGFEWLGDNPLQLRSEEHTSELQSREKLVCRLLLEKKKFIHLTFKYYNI